MPNRKAYLFAVASAALALACGQTEPDGPLSSLALQLRVPPAVNVTSVELTILDAAAQCSGPDAVGGSALLVDTIQLGVAKTVKVSPGQRTFSVVAFDGSTPVARGCDRATLEAGKTHTVNISLEEYPGEVDAGVDAAPSDAGPDAAADAAPDAAPDAGPDAGVVDADTSPDADTTPDAGPTGGDCSDPIVLVAGVPAAGSTVGTADDFASSCGGGGNGDLVYELTLTEASHVTLVADAPGAAVFLALRSACATPASELGCATPVSDTTTLDLATLPAGTYYVVVDAADGGVLGDFTLTATVEASSGPLNDTCAAPVTLSSGVAQDGTLTGATDQAAASCGGSGGADAFYLLTLGEEQRVDLSVTGTGFDPVLHLRTACGDDGSEIAGGCSDATSGADTGETMVFRNLPAGTYYVVVDSAGGTGDFTVTATLSPPAPVNDLCAGAIALTAGVVAHGDTSASFDDAAVSCGVAGSGEVYYSFTLGATSHVRLDLTDTGASQHTLQLLDGCGGSELDCQNGVSATETIYADYLAAGSYVVVVEAATAGGGTFDLLLTTTAPPLGDGCSDPVTLNSGTTTGQQLTSSYVDDGAGTCGGAGVDRVYTFTTFVNQHVEITTIGTFDHVLYVRQSDCAAGTEMDCSVATGSGPYTANYSALDLAPGTYYVFVDAATAGATGTFQITLTVTAPAPGNDTCAAPETIALGDTASGTLVNANDDYAGSCGGSGGEDAVYQFTLTDPARVRATLTRTGGSFNPVLYLRSSCASAVSELAGGCADAGASYEVIDIDQVPAGTYYLIVDSGGGTTGTFDVKVEALPVPPANDRCAGSISLSAGVTASGTTVDARDDTTGDCSSGGVEVFYDLTLATSRRVIIQLTNATAQHALYLQDECGNPVSQVACASTAGLDETIEILDLAAGTYSVVVESEAAGGGTFDLTYTEFDPVPNDTCGEPLTLTAGVPRTDTTVGAHDDETITCGAGSSPDIVYTYTLTEASTVHLSLTSDFDAAVAIRNPPCTEELGEVVCDDSVGGAGTQAIDIRNQPAGTYYVIVDGVNGAAGIVDIELTTSAPPPAGDYCPEVVPLAEGTTSNQSLSTSYADDDAGTCGGTGGRERVYSFTLSGEQQVDITTSAATFDHALYLRSDSCDSGTEEDCQLASGSGPYTAALSFAALPAGTYYVFVDSLGGTGTFNITLTISGVVYPPPNDQCVDASALTALLPASGTLAAAADDTDTACVAAGAPDVYYLITLTDTSRLLAQVTSSIDTAVALRSADCTTELACTNATGTGETLDYGYLEPGDYYLVVEGVGGAEGSFTIVYNTAAPRPENDQCAGAHLLSDGVALVGETTLNGLNDATGSCGGDSSADVVYQFTVPGGPNQRARITVSNASGFDPIVYARSGSCTGTEVDCAQTGTGTSEVLDMPSLAPGDYYVWVDANAGGTGTFDILLDLLSEVPPPANDTCAAPDLLTEGVDEGPFSTVGATDDYDLSCLAFDAKDTTHEIDLASEVALLVTLTPQAPDWNLAAALRGDCAAGPDLSCVASRFTPRYINYPDLIAGTYSVIVDGDSGAVGDYNIRYDTATADTTFGYWVLEWTDTFTPLTGATTIPISTGNPDGDGWSKAVALPFDFDYFGTVYPETTLLTLTDDMYATFDAYVGGSESYNNDCLDDTAPNNMIAPFWDDGMAYAATAQLLYKIEGTAPERKLVIEWRDFDVIGPSPQYYIISVKVSHQVVLFENGDIEFRYGPRQAPSPGNVECRNQDLGCSATIGIEAGTAGDHDADVVDCLQENTYYDIDTGIGRVIHFVHPTN